MSQIRTDPEYRTQLKDRFWAKVNKKRGLGPEGKCWEWTGAKTGARSGAGSISIVTEDGRHGTINPRLVAFEIVYGHKLEKGHEVYQTCGNPFCVRDEHLAAKLSGQGGEGDWLQFYARSEDAKRLKQGAKKTKVHPNVLAARALALGLDAAIAEFTKPKKAKS